MVYLRKVTLCYIYIIIYFHCSNFLLYCYFHCYLVYHIIYFNYEFKFFIF